ncbi:vanadium-dependent haloperoxidase [Bacillus sp. CGMCC 1.16541]|uniref:vanadium-dependent haloperoxidase n=1 Tax=Bacillus sp. CGMCC 1.16541 TaxID=2185143 RepID=UPI000D731EEA|nr:vanadium-dependent haloperoxidase [Bacillus sp. CGMCC 1.16541]
MRTPYRKWSAYPYQGEQVPPVGLAEAGSWELFFLKRKGMNEFTDPFGRPIQWAIKDPNEINWNEEMTMVQRTLLTSNPQQAQIATYWGTGELTEKVTTTIYRLGGAYRLGSPDIARMLAYYHSAVHDTCVMTWYLKYLWDVARPNQYGVPLQTVLFTPRFPGYPSAHATIAGCSEEIIGYLFPQQKQQMRMNMEQAAISRLYAGVHFKVDNDEGLRLGRQIGKMVVNVMKENGVKTYGR